MDNKEKYRKFCMDNSSVLLFLQAWWLDASSGERNWDVALVEKGDRIISCFPYVIKKTVFFRALGIPLLTPFLGIWIDYPQDQKYTNKLSYEKKVFNELIKQLPRFDKFYMPFHYSITNWQPFYWNGFRQTTRYTYVIDKLKPLDTIFSGFRENIRREIRKAQKRVKIHNDGSIEKLYSIHKLTFSAQNKKPIHSLDFVKKMDQACSKQKCRKMFFAEDPDGKIHAALYLVWDSQSSYYLIGGVDPKNKNSGAMSLVMWEAIKFSSEVTCSFNFEGSMIEPIERFFRAFGAAQKSYHLLTKTNSRIINLIQLFRNSFM